MQARAVSRTWYRGLPLDVAQLTESFRMVVHPAALLIHSLEFAYDNSELIVTSERARFVQDPEAIITRRYRRGRGQRTDPARRLSFNLALLDDHFQELSDNRGDLPTGRVFTDAEEEALRVLFQWPEEIR